MIITKFGSLIIEKDVIRVEGWTVQRQSIDPPGAKMEELLLAAVTEWALDRLQKAVNVESMAAISKEAKRLRTEALLSEVKGN
jgi:hypothetical protein